MRRVQPEPEVAGPRAPDADRSADNGHKGQADGGAEAVEGALREIKRLFTIQTRLARLRWLQVKLTVRRAGWVLVLRLWGALLGIVVSIAAAIAIVGGVTGGATALVGAPWAGDLLGGSIVVGATAGTVWLMRRRADARHFRRARASAGASQEDLQP